MRRRNAALATALPKLNFNRNKQRKRARSMGIAPWQSNLIMSLLSKVASASLVSGVAVLHNSVEETTEAFRDAIDQVLRHA